MQGSLESLPPPANFGYRTTTMKLFTNATADHCLCRPQGGPCQVMPIGGHKYICLHTMQQHALEAHLTEDGKKCAK